MAKNNYKSMSEEGKYVAQYVTHPNHPPHFHTPHKPGGAAPRLGKQCMWM